MKTKLYTKIGSTLFLILLAVSFIRCSKDEVTPDYIGKWELMGDKSKSVFTIGSNSALMQGYSLQNENSYYLVSALNADLEVNRDIFDLYYTKMQIDTSFKSTGVPSGILTIYTKEMYSNIPGIDSLWHLQYRYEVNGDRLNLYFDTISYEFNRIQ